jgi:hypothetical protein
MHTVSIVIGSAVIKRGFRGKLGCRIDIWKRAELTGSKHPSEILYTILKNKGNIIMNIHKQTIRFNRIINGLLLTAIIGSSGALAHEWVSLDGGIPAETVFRPSLAADLRLNPVLGFEKGGVSVVRWRKDKWENLGPPIMGASGPSIGLDAQEHIYLCDSGKYASTGAPNVFLWEGKTWRSIGGDIAVEAGYKIAGSSARHVVDACGGIVLDSSSNPIVTWGAEVGVKSWAVFAAQWDKKQKSWKGLGEGAVVGGRVVSTYLDIDATDHPYLATTYTNGNGLSRVTTTQVWRWDGHVWDQLGADMPNAEGTVIGVYENTPYLALHYVDHYATGTIHTDELRVMRWRGGSWQALPSPSKGFSSPLEFTPALDFTPSGKPVVAYLESLDQGQTVNILVKYWTGKTWQSAGDKVASLPCYAPASCPPAVLLDISLDPQGRPIVAWGEYDYLAPSSLINVKRYSSSLP